MRPFEFKELPKLVLLSFNDSGMCPFESYLWLKVSFKDPNINNNNKVKQLTTV